MDPGARFVFVAAIAVLLVTPAAAAAKSKAITGKLTKDGYSVIAVASDGEGKAVVASREFSVRPPAKRATLHLRDKNGVYAGPVVVETANDGERAIQGVERGAKLGKVKVDTGKGYAKVKSLADRWIDDKRVARAAKGVPIGAGNFGLVRAKIPRGSPPGDLDADGIADLLDIDANGNLVLDRYEEAAVAPPTVRSDHGTTRQESGVNLYVVVSGVNGNAVDYRICGNDIELTADWPSDAPAPVVGKSYFVEAKQVGQAYEVLSVAGPITDGCPPAAFVPRVTPMLILTLKDTVNANIASLTQADFDAALADRGLLWINGPAESAQELARVELDCGGTADASAATGWSGGLSYCTKGGTGRAMPGVLPNSPPRAFPFAFPVCCDADGNGFGELTALEQDSGDAPCPSRCVSALFSHGATSKRIGTGDVLNWRIAGEDGGTTEFPTALEDVYGTVPSLVSYSDGAGNSSTISYPVPPPYVGSPPDFLNASQGPYEGLPVAPCPAGAPAPCVEGDIVVTFTFWPPQRPAVPGAEQGEWTDIGGLVYAVGAFRPNFPALPNCGPPDLSTADPRLTLTPSNTPFSDGYGFRDSSPDQPVSPGDPLTLTANLSKCISRVDDPGSAAPQSPQNLKPPESGEDIRVFLQAGQGSREAVGTLNAVQQILFTVE